LKSKKETNAIGWCTTANSILASFIFTNSPDAMIARLPQAAFRRCKSSSGEITSCDTKQDVSLHVDFEKR